MRAHIVENGIVINTIMVGSLGERPGLIDGSTGAIGDHYDAETGTFSRPPPTIAPLSERRAAVVAAINTARDDRLASGAPYGGKLIAVDDRGRADLGGMSIAALLALSGTVPWSEGYSRGWITMDNSRVPLPTSANGLALAASVGDWYGRTVQHARDLKDEALASADPETIDITIGWP